MSRLRRTVLTLDRYISSPVRWDVTGPVCALCTVDENDPAVVDSESLVEGLPGVENNEGQVTTNAAGTFCKVLVKHHGCEELREFDFGSVEWGPTDLRKAMQRVRWFSPEDAAGQDGRLQL